MSSTSSRVSAAAAGRRATMNRTYHWMLALCTMAGGLFGAALALR